MKQYINRRIMIIASAAILMTAVFCIFACYRVFREEVKENLRICTRLLSDKENIQNEATLSKVASELYNDSIRLTLISKDGDVIFDNVAKIEGLDNHLNREEIEKAIGNGEGYSVRRSATINRTNYYYAVRLEDTRKFAGEIHKNADRLLTLINDILRLSEFDVLKESDFETEEVDLYDIAGTCLDMLEFKAREHDISLRLEGEKTLVTANRNMIEEVVYNLCDNAIRYNRPGGYIRVYAGNHMLIVSDNGIGISPEYQNRVFERFFRVDKSRSKRTGGTGLGLAIVKHIVTLHGAELSLESTPEQGTTVLIRFPDK